ncbi:GNAT family N-acetyltransferase [Amedibacillus sp. YH-ame6]
MALADLYYLSDHEIDRLYKTFAKDFYMDDLYCTLFKDDKKRELFLNKYFKHYIQLIRPYCYFVANDKKQDCIMVVFDSALENKRYCLRVVSLNLKMLIVIIRLFSWSGIRHLISCWDMFTSRWIKDFVREDYLHLDLLSTREEKRGQGLAGTMLEQIVEEASLRHCDITMETHHKENLKLYERYGFMLMSTISHENDDVIQYNLLNRREKESK